MSDVRKLCNCLAESLAQREQRKRREPQSFDRKKLIYPFRIIRRPFDSFSDIKYEGKGSLTIANSLLILFFISNILRFFCTGYIFNTNLPKDFNVLMELLYSVILIVLWCVSNWAVCTLMDGEGKFREIWIVVCYALLPRIVGQCLVIILSNLLALNEKMFLSMIDTVSIGLMGLLILLGMLVVHQYTLLKTVLSSLLTVFGIIAILFVCVLFFSVVQQMVGFGETIYMEILNKL